MPSWLSVKLVEVLNAKMRRAYAYFKGLKVSSLVI